MYDEVVKKVNAIGTIDTSDLLKKTDQNTKINETENNILDHDYDEYITTQESNRLMAETFANELKQTNLASKNNITDFVKNTDFDNKLKNISKGVTSNKKNI